MIFRIEEKSIILTRTIYCLAFAIYPRATYGLVYGPGSQVTTDDVNNTSERNYKTKQKGIVM